MLNVATMKRLHLFEFEDLPWFPASLRDMMTDLLGLTIEVGRLYHPVLPLLAKALQTTGDRSILDLCSGGGGPVPGLRRRLAKDYGLAVEVQLSDFYPNVGAFQRIAASQGSGLTFVPTPIDATQVRGSAWSHGVYRLFVRGRPVVRSSVPAVRGVVREPEIMPCFEEPVRGRALSVEGSFEPAQECLIRLGCDHVQAALQQGVFGRTAGSPQDEVGPGRAEGLRRALDQLALERRNAQVQGIAPGRPGRRR